MLLPAMLETPETQHGEGREGSARLCQSGMLVVTWAEDLDIPGHPRRLIVKAVDAAVRTWMQDGEEWFEQWFEMLQSAIKQH